MQRSTRTAAAAVILVSLAVLGGSSQSSSGGTAAYPKGAINFTVATPPSGGGAIASEAIVAALKKSGTVKVPINVRFVPGGSGTVGFTTFSLQNKGADNALMLALPSLLSNPPIQQTTVTYKDFTPIARLFSEYEMLTVKANSPIKNLHDLAVALKKDPKQVRFFGGSVGSADQIVVTKFAIAAGVSVKKVIYVGESGGDTQVAQLLGGHTDVLVGGTDNIDLVESGDARALAVSSPQRLAGRVAAVPTFVEQGYKMTELNWRSVVGPKNMPKYARDYWVNAFKKMTESAAWKDTLEKNSWSPTTLFGDQFGVFLKTQSAARIKLLKELGLIG